MFSESYTKGGKRAKGGELPTFTLLISGSQVRILLRLPLLYRVLILPDISRKKWQNSAIARAIPVHRERTETVPQAIFGPLGPIISLGGFRDPIIGPVIIVFRGASACEAKHPPLTLPLEGQCADALEAPCGKFDGLAPGEYGFNYVGRQEYKLETAPDVACVNPAALRDLLD